MTTKIGVVSDTHGLFRPELAGVFNDVDMILHAGDIGPNDVISDLHRLAPTVAIRGNIDKSGPESAFPDHEIVKVGNKSIYMLHDLKTLDVNPVSEGFHVVVSGHSHKPLVYTEEGVLFVNPGSAGRRRFSLPVACAILNVGTTISAEVVELVS